MVQHQTKRRQNAAYPPAADVLKIRLYAGNPEYLKLGYPDGNVVANPENV